MEKRKWDVNSISVIQFSCEIKRKARIWEIWKLQLQDKWYLKGSYLIWLNFSSNVIIEMHYSQVFQSFCLWHPKLCSSHICAGKLVGWGRPEEILVLRTASAVQPLPCGLAWAWGCRGVGAAMGSVLPRGRCRCGINAAVGLALPCSGDPVPSLPCFRMGC